MSCSYFSDLMIKNKAENPIIPDNSRGLTTFAINPSRRLVIVKPLPSSDRELMKMAFEGKKIDKFLPKQICGEPPPDVSDNIASALSSALFAKGEVAEKGSAEFASNFAKTLNTSAVLLFKRTQGLQLYRDGMYHLCLAIMNNIYTTEEYRTTAKALLDASVQLIKEEIPRIEATAAEISAQNAASSATEAKKAAVDTEMLSKSSKQFAEAAEAAAKNSKQSAETAEAAAKKTAEKK